MNSFYLSSNER